MRKNSVVINTTHGLVHFPYLTLQVKTASSKTIAGPQLVLNDKALTIPPRTAKIHSICWSSLRMEHNRHSDTIVEKYKISKSADFPVNVDNNWRKNSSHGNQNNKITISNQKAHTVCRVLRSHTRQSKYIKPLDEAILSVIPEGDPYLTAYSHQLLRT